MTPQEFIVGRLKDLKTKPELSPFENESLEDFIFRAVLSKKFRKYSVNPPEYKDHIKSAIKLNVSKKEPIKLTLVFGGYKLWRLDETPEVDWAELFSFIYYANWLKPVAEVYPPGVWLDFYSDDVILEPMDNISKKETDQYLQSFRQLLDFIKPYPPDNLKFTLNRVGDQYPNDSAFKKELAESIKQVEKELGGLPRLSPEQKDLVELNVRLKPGQDKDPLWREKVFLIHEGYTHVSKRRPYYRTPDKIMVSTRPIDKSIAPGTTKKSVVKFWVGAGVLEKEGGSFMENILSPNRLASGHFLKEKMAIPGLEGKNFSSIRISQG